MIPITSQTIELFTKYMCEPDKIGVDLRPLKEVFIKSDKITPNHILYDKYINYIENRPFPKGIFYVPKIMFYIIMVKVFGRTSVDYTNEDGSAGYYLDFNDNIMNGEGSMPEEFYRRYSNPVLIVK